MKLVKLENNVDKVQKYNDWMDELNSEYQEEKFNHIDDIYDELIPYRKWREYLGGLEYKLIDSDLEVDNVYIVPLNWGYLLDNLTDYRIEDKYSLRNPYGVCDNAQQAIDYCKEKLKDNDDKEDQEYILTMTPIFRHNQEEFGGWRWHKWGRYIGVQDRKHEYLYDEDIDLVYVFRLNKVQKNKEIK